jgi:hypothetical protein
LQNPIKTKHEKFYFGNYALNLHQRFNCQAISQRGFKKWPFASVCACISPYETAQYP